MQHSGDYNSFRLIIVFSMFLGYVLEVEWLCCINMEWPGFVLKYTISDSMVPHPHESEVIFLLVIRFGSSFSLWFHHKFVPQKRLATSLATKESWFATQNTTHLRIKQTRARHPFQTAVRNLRDRCWTQWDPLFTEPSHAGPSSKWFQQVSTGGWSHPVGLEVPNTSQLLV